VMPPLGGADPALFCDLYELTMAAAYHREDMEGRATFELFVRSLPAERNFLVACGLDDALEYVQSIAFDDDAVGYLRGLGLFDETFLERLARLRFTGEIRAVPEGEVVFAGEPLLEVTAPVIEAQVLETALLNLIGFRTMVASKAARVALACGDTAFVDFAARRVHGVDAALGAARAAFVAGARATSLVGAGRRWGLELSGTMAHAFVMAFDDERDAFRSYARAFPAGVILLIDTYDTVIGARHAAEVARELAAEGITVAGVRLDSGDLAALAKQVRAVLDEAGCSEIRVLASGDLDEHRIAELLAGGAPIDAFGVGTRMGTSADAPSLGVVYKLVEDEVGPKLKLAEGKATLPGRKQVWRCEGYDVLSLVDETVDGRPLLETVMYGGRRVAPSPPVTALQQRCRAAVAEVPARLKALEPADAAYDVRLSPLLQNLVEKLTEAHRS
jgi:nicotinate phosphoribosyltransferase